MRRIDGELYPSPGELELYRFYSTIDVSRIALWCHTCDTTIITDAPPDQLWLNAVAAHRGHAMETVTAALERLVQRGPMRTADRTGNEDVGRLTS